MRHIPRVGMVNSIKGGQEEWHRKKTQVLVFIFYGGEKEADERQE